MTPDLDRWLQQATRSLSKDSAAKVRMEKELPLFPFSYRQSNLTGSSFWPRNFGAKASLIDCKKLSGEGFRYGGLVADLADRRYSIPLIGHW